MCRWCLDAASKGVRPLLRERSISLSRPNEMPTLADHEEQRADPGPGTGKRVDAPSCAAEVLRSRDLLRIIYECVDGPRDAFAAVSRLWRDVARSSATTVRVDPQEADDEFQQAFKMGQLVEALSRTYTEVTSFFFPAIPPRCVASVLNAMKSRVECLTITCDLGPAVKFDLNCMGMASCDRLWWLTLAGSMMVDCHPAIGELQAFKKLTNLNIIVPNGQDMEALFRGLAGGTFTALEILRIHVRCLSFITVHGDLASLGSSAGAAAPNLRELDFRSNLCPDDQPEGFELSFQNCWNILGALLGRDGCQVATFQTRHPRSRMDLLGNIGSVMEAFPRKPTSVKRLVLLDPGTTLLPVPLAPASIVRLVKAFPGLVRVDIYDPAIPSALGRMDAARVSRSVLECPVLFPHFAAAKLYAAFEDSLPDVLQRVKDWVIACPDLEKVLMAKVRAMLKLVKKEMALLASNKDLLHSTLDSCG